MSSLHVLLSQHCGIASSPKPARYEESKERLSGLSQDILSAIERIKSYTVEGKDTFFIDKKPQDAVIRQFSIIGEASAKLSLAMKTKHKEVPWKDIIGMRNIIIHDYSETDLPVIWDTVERGLPPLKNTVEAMLKEAAK